MKLSKLILPCVALVATASLSHAQGGNTTYKDIVIVNATYSPTGSSYTIDMNGNGVADAGDLVVTDPGNLFYTQMWNEYTYQIFGTNIVVNNGKLVAVEQWTW